MSTVYVVAQLSMVGRKADQYRINGEKAWLPISQIQVTKHPVLGQSDVIIEMPKWLAEEKNITPLTNKELKQVRFEWNISYKQLQLNRAASKYAMKHSISHEQALGFLEERYYEVRMEMGS